MAQDEIVGYVERRWLDECVSLPRHGVVAPTPQRSDHAFLIPHLRWSARGPLEQDPTKKQIIPYVLFMRDGRIWTMRRLRAQRESRLHDRLSVGVGGHINPTLGSQDPILAGMWEEIEEEIMWRGPRARPSFVGLLNDDRDEVGLVHVGVIFTVEVSEDATIAIRETQKLEGRWRAVDSLIREDAEALETWSRIALDHVSGR